MIQGLSHITIIVKDVDRTVRLLCEGLGAEELYDSKGKNDSISREKFFMLGGVWLVTMEGKTSEPSYRHVAFKVNSEVLHEIECKIKHLDAKILTSRPRIDGEGQSLYFYDYDNNLFELHTGDLRERLNRYNKDQADGLMDVFTPGKLTKAGEYRDI